METKKCKKCGKVKTKEDFPRHANMKDKRINTCKECARAYQKNRRAINN